MTDAQNHWLQLGDLRLHVREWGDSSHPLLVLLHGLASTSHMFDLIAPPLAQRYHVIAPDQRGHGLSDKPTTGYDFETIAGDMDRLLDAYNADQAVIIGHSWGAYTTLYYAATRPERVRRAGLIDGGIEPLADKYATWAEAEAKMSPPTYINRTVEDIEHLIQFDWLGSAYRPELLPLALSVFDTSNPNHVHAHLSRVNHMQIARAIWEMRPSEYFARVKCPLLIVSALAPGQSVDPQMAAYIRQAEQSIDKLRVVWLEDTGHDIPWQRPEVLVSLIEDFLRDFS